MILFRSYDVRFIKIVLTGFAFCLASATAMAEQSQTFGDYVVHYNAFTTEIITPAVAKQYGIKRSKNRAMYNITVLKKVMGTTGKPTEAKVTGHAFNLNRQMKTLNPRKVTEGTAIYYIGDLAVTDKETLEFSFQITPADKTSPFEISFRQQFFTN